MSEIRFRLLPTSEPLEFPEAETAGVRRVADAAAVWADANGFGSLTFWLDEPQGHKFHVSLNDDRPLTSWVDAAVFRKGQVEKIEDLLDFARGEHFRREVGYDKYNH